MSKQFKSLSKKEKDVYVEKAALLKKTYDEEKIESLKNKDEETKNEGETPVVSEEPVATVVKKPRGQKKGKELTESKDDDNEEDVENNGPGRQCGGEESKYSKESKESKKRSERPQTFTHHLHAFLQRSQSAGNEGKSGQASPRNWQNPWIHVQEAFTKRKGFICKGGSKSQRAI